MIRFTVFALFLSLLSRPCSSQELWKYPPVELDPNSPTALLLEEAGKNVERGHVPEAIEIYLTLADQNQGTSIGLQCLWNAMVASIYGGDKTGYEALRQRLIREYPDSSNRVQADLMAVEEQYFGANSPQKIQAYSDLVQQYGAARLDDVLAGRDLDGNLAKMATLHPETRLGLMGTYYDVCYMMRNQKRWDEALRMATFGAAVFDTHPQSDNMFTKTVRSMLSARSGNDQVGTLPADPRVTIVSPSPGSRVGTQPTISVRLSSGDYRRKGLRLDSLELKVDGMNQKLSSTIKSEVDTSLTEGAEFEVLTVTYSPTLAVGQHTVEVKVSGMPTRNDPPSGPASATETWSFTVSDNPPPPPPTDQTLNVSKDSILSQQNPHRNEGANDLLQLSHRPEERNKSNNPIIAFDLANVNLTGLRKARLVLNIQECEQPKKWGPEGRNILAYPVNEDWVEGNGETIKAGHGEKTRGSGQGVTWFSPIDDDIANKAPNGALQWSGARPFLGPLTAPPVQIVNKQVGTIEFDVTQDVQSGFIDGWLVRKQDETAFGNVRLYSKEGSTTLAPRLILEYGDTALEDSKFRGLAFGEGDLSSALADLGLQAASGLSPFFQLGQTAFRSWAFAIPALAERQSPVSLRFLASTGS